GRTDVVAYRLSDNTLWVCENENTKSQFKRPRQWAKVSDNRPEVWKFWVGDFTGHKDKDKDSRMDLVGYCNHRLWVGENTRVGFYFWFGAEVSDNRPYDWDFSVGDFVGDGRIHILGYMSENRSLWVGRNMGQFYFGLWGIAPVRDGSWKITPGR